MSSPLCCVFPGRADPDRRRAGGGQQVRGLGGGLGVGAEDVLDGGRRAPLGGGAAALPRGRQALPDQAHLRPVRQDQPPAQGQHPHRLGTETVYWHCIAVFRNLRNNELLTVLIVTSVLSLLNNICAQKLVNKDLLIPQKNCEKYIYT